MVYAIRYVKEQGYYIFSCGQERKVVARHLKTYEDAVAVIKFFRNEK